MQLLIHTEFAQILTQCCQHDIDREDSAAVIAANTIYNSSTATTSCSLHLQQSHTFEWPPAGLVLLHIVNTPHTHAQLHAAC